MDAFWSMFPTTYWGLRVALIWKRRMLCPYICQPVWPVLPFLPWHWIHHPTETLRYQHLHSTITIRHSMGPHKLIMPTLSKAHWLLREAKAEAWVDLSLDLLHSAMEVCSNNLSYVLVLSTYSPISKAWHFFLLKNDWWWEIFIAQMKEGRKTFMNHAVRKLDRVATFSSFQATNR